MPTRTYLALIATVAVVFCVALVARGEEVSNSELHFSVTIPDGFIRDARLAAAQRDFMLAFRKTEPGAADVVIIIERMHGVLGRERLDRTKMPPGFAGRLFTARWNDFDLDAIEVPEMAGGVSMINYNVQVPLKPEAIQLRVLGGQDQQVQLLALANTLLASLRGESNWLHSSAPPALAQSRYYPAIKLTVMCLFIIGGLIILWMLRRVSGRGTVLGLAVLIYATSFLIGPGETSEMRGTVGAVRLLGFLGFILGLVDLFRRRAAKPTSKPMPISLPPIGERNGDER